jgi:hypothetical protein
MFAVGRAGDIVGCTMTKREAAGAQAEQACEAENLAARSKRSHKTPRCEMDGPIPPIPADEASLLQQQAAVPR